MSVTNNPSPDMKVTAAGSPTTGVTPSTTVATGNPPPNLNQATSATNAKANATAFSKDPNTSTSLNKVDAADPWSITMQGALDMISQGTKDKGSISGWFTQAFGKILFSIANAWTQRDYTTEKQDTIRKAEDDRNTKIKNEWLKENPETGSVSTPLSGRNACQPYQIKGILKILEKETDAQDIHSITEKLYRKTDDEDDEEYVQPDLIDADVWSTRVTLAKMVREGTIDMEVGPDGHHKFRAHNK